MTRATKRERAEAIANLREQLQPGDVIFTRLNHVSASGMTRWLDLFVIRDNEPLRLTWSAAAATDYTYCDRRESFKIEGCGMDMGFSAVLQLGRALWPTELIHRTDGPTRFYALKHGTRYYVKTFKITYGHRGGYRLVEAL